MRNTHRVIGEIGEAAGRARRTEAAPDHLRPGALRGHGARVYLKRGEQYEPIR